MGMTGHITVIEVLTMVPQIPTHIRMHMEILVATVQTQAAASVALATVVPPVIVIAVVALVTNEGF
jgi:ABC-type antimicrobial peptide transport system ATPase subunit